jgi:hypothetical protein
LQCRVISLEVWNSLKGILYAFPQNKSYVFCWICAQVKRRATELAEAMADEDGVQGAVDVFHKHIRKFLPDIMHSTTTPPSDSPALRRRNKSFLKSCWSCGSSKLKTSV